MGGALISGSLKVHQHLRVRPLLLLNERENHYGGRDEKARKTSSGRHCALSARQTGLKFSLRGHLPPTPLRPGEGHFLKTIGTWPVGSDFLCVNSFLTRGFQLFISRTIRSRQQQPSSEAGRQSSWRDAVVSPWLSPRQEGEGRCEKPSERGG